MSVIKEKFKEAALSILPVMAIMLFISISIGFDVVTIISILISTMLLIVGIGLFTYGADLSMIEIGKSVSSQLIKSKKVFLITVISFLVGLVITIAEPDLKVLAQQMNAINSYTLILSVGIGVGLFLSISVLRIMYQINLKGKKVTIVDERSEIAACYNGVPQMNVGIRTDVLDNCLKKSGMIMAIRSLSPEVLICDEIGTDSDLEALNMAFNSGVNIIVTVHGYDIDDIYNRRIFKELIDNCILERVILLSNKKGVGTIEKIYKISRGKGLECLEMY